MQTFNPPLAHVARISADVGVTSTSYVDIGLTKTLPPGSYGIVGSLYIVQSVYDGTCRPSAKAIAPASSEIHVSFFYASTSVNAYSGAELNAVDATVTNITASGAARVVRVAGTVYVASAGTVGIQVAIPTSGTATFGRGSFIQFTQ